MGGIRARRRRLSSAGAGGGRHDGTGHHGAGCRGLVNRLWHGSPAGRYGGGRVLTSSNAHFGRRSLWSNGRERPGCPGRQGHVQGVVPVSNPTRGAEGPTGLRCTAQAVRTGLAHRGGPVPLVDRVGPRCGFPTAFCMTRVMRRPTSEKGSGRERERQTEMCSDAKACDGDRFSMCCVVLRAAGQVAIHRSWGFVLTLWNKAEAHNTMNMYKQTMLTVSKQPKSKHIYIVAVLAQGL